MLLLLWTLCRCCILYDNNECVFMISTRDWLDCWTFNGCSFVSFFFFIGQLQPWWVWSGLDDASVVYDVVIDEFLFAGLGVCWWCKSIPRSCIRCEKFIHIIKNFIEFISILNVLFSFFFAHSLVFVVAVVGFWDFDVTIMLRLMMSVCWPAWSVFYLQVSVFPLFFTLPLSIGLTQFIINKKY